VENIPCQALRMYPHQHRLRRRNIAHLQHHGVFGVGPFDTLESKNTKVSKAAGKIGLCNFTEFKGGWHSTRGLTPL
jgi:hypothetical protein